MLSLKRQGASPKDNRPINELHAIIEKDLENECKLDACVDNFVLQLVELAGARYFSRIPKDKFRRHLMQKRPGYIKIEDELIYNVNRLVPGYFDTYSEQEPLSPNTTLYSKIQERLSKSELKRLQCSKQPLDFPAQVVSYAAENYTRRRTKLSNTPGATSLQEAVLRESYHQLKCSVTGSHPSATFTCGGSIDLTRSSKDTPWSSRPVRLFWSANDVGRDQHPRSLLLPVKNYNSGQVRQLLSDCVPVRPKKRKRHTTAASIGQNWGHMDTNQFATTFNLASLDILSCIERILLPTGRGEARYSGKYVTATLCQLTIHSASTETNKTLPIESFDCESGCLVVCLPSLFQGGELSIQYGNQEFHCDWARRSGSKIQWAAFYGGCQQKIKPITKGHRITLTYSLKIRHPFSQVSMGPESLPFYARLRGLLELPVFLRNGGIVGIFCQHPYRHNSQDASTRVVRELMGSDLATYMVFDALNIQAEVLPVLQVKANQCSEDGEKINRNSLRLWKEGKVNLDYLEIDQTFDDHKLHLDDVDKRWKLLFMSRRVTENLHRLPTHEGAFTGTALHPYITVNKQWFADDYLIEFTNSHWPHYCLPGITWLSDPMEAELAFTASGMSSMSSYAAIIAIIPPWSERGAMLNGLDKLG